MMQRHAAQQSLRVLRCTAGAGLRCRARSASVSSRASYATNQTGRSLGFLLLGGSFAATLALASYTVQASDESLATLLRLPVARAEEPKDLPISAHIQLDQTPVHCKHQHRSCTGQNRTLTLSHSGSRHQNHVSVDLERGEYG